MEHSQQRKVTGTLNHLKSNITQALKCSPTLSELIVIALYRPAISKPHMCLVCTETVMGIGIDKLATLHALVQTQLQTLITDPLVWLGPAVILATATLDNSKCDNSEVLKALCTHE